MEKVDQNLVFARQAAESLGLLDTDGKLMPIDSLMVIDLIVALEEIANVEIPASQLDHDTFASLESIAAMISRL